MSYLIMKELEFDAAHKLTLPYDSKCNRLHGHTWRVQIFLRCDSLEGEGSCGMVMDFADIKRIISEKFDHRYLNEIEPFDSPDYQPTAENIARYISELFPLCSKVILWESASSFCEYIPEAPGEILLPRIKPEEKGDKKGK